MRYEGEVPSVWIRFDQENQTDAPDPEIPRKTSVPGMRPESHLRAQENDVRPDSIQRTGDGPANRKIRTVKIQQKLFKEGATLGLSLIGNKVGGAMGRLSRLNSLSCAPQATNCLQAKAAISALTGHGYWASLAATIKGNDLSTSFISYSTFEQSTRTMSKQYQSKEFIGSSDSSSSSGGDKQPVGLGRSERDDNRARYKKEHRSRVEGSSSRSSDDRSSGSRKQTTVVQGTRTPFK